MQNLCRMVDRAMSDSGYVQTEVIVQDGTLRLDRNKSGSFVTFCLQDQHGAAIYLTPDQALLIAHKLTEFFREG